MAADARVPRKPVVPAKEMFPLLRILNFVAPDLLAVKISPAPDWSVTRAEKLVDADMDAAGVVAVLPLISRVARGDVVPSPTVPATAPIERVVEFAVRSSLLVEVVEMTGDEPVSWIVLSASCRISLPESMTMIPVVVPPRVRV